MSVTTEQALYQNGSTFISRARAVIAGTTFAIGGISSVRTQIETKRNYWPALVLFLAGFFIGIFANIPIIAAIAAFLGITVFMATRPVTTYKIITVTHGREFGMLSTTDAEEAQRIVSALNEALVAQSK